MLKQSAEIIRIAIGLPPLGRSPVTGLTWNRGQHMPEDAFNIEWKIELSAPSIYKKQATLSCTRENASAHVPLKQNA